MGKARRPQRANRLGAKRLMLRSQLRGVTWVPRPMLLLLMLGALLLVTLLQCCSGGVEKRATAQDALRRRLPDKKGEVWCSAKSWKCGAPTCKFRNKLITLLLDHQKDCELYKAHKTK